MLSFWSLDTKQHLLLAQMVIITYQFIHHDLNSFFSELLKQHEMSYSNITISIGTH